MTQSEGILRYKTCDCCAERVVPGALAREKGLGIVGLSLRVRNIEAILILIAKRHKRLIGRKKPYASALDQWGRYTLKQQNGA